MRETRRKWETLDKLVEHYGAEHVLIEFMTYLKDDEMNQLIQWFIETVAENDEGWFEE